MGENHAKAKTLVVGESCVQYLLALEGCIGDLGYQYTFSVPLEGSNTCSKYLLRSLESSSTKPDLIEMDVQETKDGQFVMMHDVTLNR